MKNKKGLYFIIIIIIVFSLASPVIFTSECEWLPNFNNTGQIGDTIGGLMNPFISIAVVIVTWLAFNEQYKANEIQIKALNEQYKANEIQIEALEEQKKQLDKEQEEQRKNIKIQRFENQFYEMLRYHKENVNEIEIEDSDGKIIKGRAAFLEMKKQLEIFLDIMSSDLGINIDRRVFIKLYEKFFWGYEFEKPKDLGVGGGGVGPGYIEEEEAISKWKEFMYNEREGKVLEKSEKINLKIDITLGHYGYLSHYYRHLFHTVKFVVEQGDSLLTKEDKLNYLGMLRAQLSNHEQAMLFYNWLSGYGKDWEDLGDDDEYWEDLKGSGNHFFTEYKMIRNLWYDRLYYVCFVTDKLKELVKTHKDLGGEEDLFEIGDGIENRIDTGSKIELNALFR